MTIDEIKAQLKKVKYVEIYPDKENGDITLFLVCSTKEDSELVYKILFENAFTASDFKNVNDRYTITLSFSYLKFDIGYSTNMINENYQYFNFLKANKVHFINTVYMDGNIFKFDIGKKIKLTMSNL